MKKSPFMISLKCVVHYLTIKKKWRLGRKSLCNCLCCCWSFAPFGCQIMVSLGDTLVWKVTKSHNKHKNKAIGEIAAPNYTFAVILQMNRPLSFEWMTQNLNCCNRYTGNWVVNVFDFKTVLICLQQIHTQPKK